MRFAFAALVSGGFLLSGNGCFPTTDGSDAASRDSTRYWSRIEYRSPDGSLGRFLIREFDTRDLPTLQFVRETATTAFGIPGNYLDSITSDSAGNPLRVRTHSFPDGSGPVRIIEHTFRSGPRIDSIIDTSFLQYSDQWAQVDTLRYRYAMDGRSDTLYLSARSLWAIRSWITGIESRDSAARILTQLEIIDSFDAYGRVTGAETTWTTTHYLTDSLTYPTSIVGRQGHGNVDSEIIVYKSNRLRDSSLFFHENTLRYAGKYDYSRMDAKKEVFRLFGSSAWPTD